MNYLFMYLLCDTITGIVILNFNLELGCKFTFEIVRFCKGTFLMEAMVMWQWIIIIDTRLASVSLAKIDLHFYVSSLSLWHLIEVQFH